MGASGYDHFYIQLTSNKSYSSHKLTFSLEITTKLEIAGQDFQKNINISRLKSPYYRLAIRKKLIFILEKYFKTLRNMIFDNLDK